MLRNVENRPLNFIYVLVILQATNDAKNMIITVVIDVVTSEFLNASNNVEEVNMDPTSTLVTDKKIVIKGIIKLIKNKKINVISTFLIFFNTSYIFLSHLTLIVNALQQNF